MIGIEPSKDGEGVEAIREPTIGAFLGARLQDHGRPVRRQAHYFRIYSGKLTSGARVLNASTGRTERIGRILMMHATTART